MMLKYYVYAYHRKDGSPYYIGKGCHKRAWSNIDRTVLKPKEQKYITILENNLSEIGAFALERRLIRWYGRKDIGTGILRNKTDGGDGSTNLSPKAKQRISAANTGRKHTTEAKKLMSKNRRGKTSGVKNPMFGKTHSQDTKQLLSTLKSVPITTPYGNFDSMKKAAVTLGLTKGQIQHYVRSDKYKDWKEAA